MKCDSRNETGLRGVTRVRNKFRAVIMINGRQSFLGSFARKEDAKRAYEAAKAARMVQVAGASQECTVC